MGNVRKKSGIKTSLPAADAERLQEFLSGVENNARHMIGYPGTNTVDFSSLNAFLEYCLNNIGDPYRDSNFKLNTHDFEREVLEWFSGILRGDAANVRGYVTSGGTEGNMYGVYLARELFPKGIVYYSEDTHYSVVKILRMVNARSIMIKSRPDGEMDYEDFATTIALHRDVPPIIFANIGTTMRGAIDNLDIIKKILKSCAVKRHYIHADAALSGMILPFVGNPQPFGFDAGIDSISVSGHKMPGVPMPCGVVLARRENIDRIASSVEYIGTSDTTLSGSRNGLTPLYLWYVIKSLGVDGFRNLISECQKRADYAIRLFDSIGVHAWRHSNSLTVVFPRAADAVLKKWQIATEKSEAHLITMPHVTYDHLEAFIAEYAMSIAGEKRGVS